MPQKYETKSFRLCRCCYKWRCQCLISRRKKPHPPFNSGSKLNDNLGLHPKLTSFATTSPAVGSYNPRPIDRKSGAISWKRQQETKEFSATMGGRLTKKIATEKKLIRTGRGPGSHEIIRWPENILEAPCKSLQRDVAFGTVPQFEPSYKSTTPGPGYTLRTHNPYYYLDQKRLKGYSCIPSFEFDGLIPRFRETKRSWSLPCNRFLRLQKNLFSYNRYSVKHPDSLQTFLEKITSKRGPYDLFTGPRDETTIKGYWTYPKSEDYGDWPRKLPGEMEKLSNKCNYFKGKWSMNPRFTKKPVARMMLQDISMCYKDPNEPGPGHYDPRTPRKPSTLKRYPFDSNIEYVRPLPPSDIRPGPGRYKIQQDYHIKGYGWTCVFKSKVPRMIGAFIPPLYSDF